jgi:hypothetical protein
LLAVGAGCLEDGVAFVGGNQFAIDADGDCFVVGQGVAPFSAIDFRGSGRKNFVL